MLRCMNAYRYTNIAAKAPFSLSSFLCELSRFTAEEQSEECAFSGWAVFSRLGEANIDKIWIGQGGKQNFFLQKACGMGECL